MTTRLAALSLASLAFAVPAQADDDHGRQGRRDFGLRRDKLLQENAEELFGVERGLGASSTASISATEAEADPTRLLTVAPGLRVRTLSARAELPPNIDQMVLWPDDRHPTHIIACNEQGTTDPGVVRVRLSDGAVETIVTGTTGCDPVRRTPWGTILFGEEAGAGGHLIELINPLATTGVTYTRSTGAFSGGQNAGNLAVRDALGTLSYEGLAVFPNGVVYYGDELRPGTGTVGGSYYKFIPEKPWTGGSAIAKLSDSPLVSGTVYGLRLGLRSTPDTGQGNNTGFGAWLPIPGAVPGPHPAVNLGAQAVILKLSGYYRPEDIDIDRAALAAGNVRFCGNNTGNEASGHNWGETICITDGTLAQALANSAKPELQFLVLGFADFAMMDNIAYQPKLGNWILQEDGDAPEAFGRNNDIWSCLDDGKDLDGLSDGCIKIATINDLTAETTGGFFNADGSKYYVSIQHNVTGHGVILVVTGWDYRGDDRWDD